MRFSRGREGAFARLRALYTPPSPEGKSLVLVLFWFWFIYCYFCQWQKWQSHRLPFPASSFRFAFVFFFPFFFVFVFRPRRKHFRRVSPRNAANKNKHAYPKPPLCKRGCLQRRWGDCSAYYESAEQYEVCTDNPSVSLPLDSSLYTREPLRLALFWPPPRGGCHEVTGGVNSLRPCGAPPSKREAIGSPPTKNKHAGSIPACFISWMEWGRW